MGREDQIVESRIRKIEELRKKGINPYPYKYEVKNIALELQNKYKKLKADSKTTNKAKVAGRVMIKRDLGKISFATLQDSSGRIQIVSQQGKGGTNEKEFEFFKKYIDAGDFVGVEGRIIKTKTGELSILISKIELLSKAILPLPEKWHGLQDEEEKFRKRYLDILTNPEIKELFIKKSVFWSTIRNFLL